jgi:hypothetical protein
MHLNMSSAPTGPVARGVRRPTIDSVVVGHAVGEFVDIEKDSINRSIKMNVPMMGPNIEFRH